MEQHQAYYETSGHVIAAAVVLSVLDIVAVVLRFAARRSQHQALKIDDWLILPATISTVGIGVSMVYGTTQQALGYRTHIPADFAGDPFDVTTYQLATTSKVEFGYSVLLPLTLGLVKSSFLFFYMRIFVAEKKSPINILLVGLIVFVTIWALAFSLATVFGCKLDVEAHWGSTHDLETKCMGSMTVVLLLCITDFAADLAIIIIPIPLVWRLNLSTQNKVAISAVFLLGSVTVAASLARLIVEGRAVNIGFAPGSDSILVITEYIYWGFVELAVAIVAACLPTLHGFLGKYSFLELPKRFKSLFRSHSNGQPWSPDESDRSPAIPHLPAGPVTHTSTEATYATPAIKLRNMESETPLFKPDVVTTSQSRSIEEV
ncbi:hypothetical protein F5B22DRAFT_630641 [Xylaria bambusicola]|uniref:uncharacterized protein n=1 Tax=Xylaria bambusicola TaxID=326684 RepID=UPI002007E5E6|nr:uncharacterized protein F5B22DRAFT_630641 [Xylaria bambusicola]KAI0503108.1 hypothetical protein F5B22DRAFT_630641 [Xylaria bambusicola]